MLNHRQKILFLEQYSKLSGGQKVLLEIIAGLDRKRYDILALLPQEGELLLELWRLNVPCRTIPLGYYSITNKTLFDAIAYFFRIPLLVKRLKKEIEQEKADLVYANGARTFIWATLACALCRVSLVWHLHSIFNRGVVRRLCLFFGKWEAVKKIIAVSEAARKPLAGLGPKVERVYNGVDTELFCPSQDKKEAPRELKVASIGLLVEWKNQEDLIRAARILVDDKKLPVKFFIVGEPLYTTRAGQRYQRKLKLLVKRFRLEERVVFYGYRTDVPQILKEMDVVVINSKTPDPCPLAMLEAMASGVVVVATDFGGPAEIIQNYKDGLLYSAGNYRQLAEKILYLAKNSPQRSAIGQAARLKVVKRFNVEEFRQRINSILDSCLK